uniref:sphinganine-1-phosphate aldolase n=1 Tax=Panagrellus redivivus TaxID=6233 RepID=A0A7E4WBK1_PANRE
MDVDGSPYRVVLHTIDNWRLFFNNNFDHLEPWQVVLYTLSWVFAIQWCRKILKYEDDLNLRKTFHALLLNIPVIRKSYEENKDKVLKKLDEKLLKFDTRKEFYKFLPDRGLLPSDIIGEAADYRAMSDLLFERRRMNASDFSDEAQSNLQYEIFKLFAYSNANFPDVFPACRKMEAEIVRMLCSLYHGGVKSTGAFTTSTTESIVLAIKAYRNRAFKIGIRKPEIIVCENGNIAYWEAAKLLGIRVVKVPVNHKFESDIGSIKRAISSETCLIVASAPSPVYGTIDAIDSICKLGIRYGVPVHVEASYGGFLLPFMEQCDFPTPPFDFRLTGVYSISLDLDKYGCCPVGASAVLYRDSELFDYHCYSETDWPGGIYVNSTLNENRPGSLIALTWATLLAHGRHGFVEKTQQILDTAHAFEDKIKEEFEDNFQVLGKPAMSVITFTTTHNSKLNIYEVADHMNEQGWNLGLLQNPDALKICIAWNQTKEGVVDEFVSDLKNIVSKLEASSGEKPYEKHVAIYGLSSAVPDYGLNDVLPKLYTDVYYSTPSQPVRSMRTLSIEGRKISQLQNYARSRLASVSVPTSGHQPLLPPSEE